MKSLSIFRSLFFMSASLVVLSCGGLEDQVQAVEAAKAVYFAVDGVGQIPSSDLKAHPEVVVVKSQRELANQAKNPVAIWIDKNAVQLVDLDWLQAEPQKSYPILLIGYNNSLYSFREQLPAFMISGPYVDWSKEKLEPGFSAWKLHETAASSTSAYMRGYAKPPTAERVLLVSGALLKGDPPPEDVP